MFGVGKEKPRRGPGLMAETDNRVQDRFGQGTP